MSANEPLTLYRARSVVTLDPAFPRAEALAVRDGRILGVGTPDELAAWGPAVVDDRFADDVAELELGADVVLARVAGVADGESAELEILAGLETDEHIVTDNPGPFGCLDVGESPGVCRVGHHLRQRSEAAVVVLGVIEVDNALAFHVGLAGKDEDLKLGGLSLIHI